MPSASKSASPSKGSAMSSADEVLGRHDATVVMVEPITAAHTIDGSGLMDIKPLLRLMDVSTCASAEKHAGVNCVTASMGDVVFEYAPQCGELLELTATPVFAGRTSLDIGLTVVAEGDGGIRRAVCNASFTYVTTRGPDGQKRMCPALYNHDSQGNGDNKNADMPETVRWERTTAHHRRSLVKTENERASLIENERGRGSGFDLELTEVVLPAHQNHMGHTFGGIIMGWMANAALVEASRKSKRKCGSLLIRSVLRVDFASGSGVSDHLIFRPRLNAIFDQGGSAEIEVRVCKRDIKNGIEMSVNTGYFYVSGIAVGNGEDKPFVSSLDFCSTAKEDVRERVKADANWRRRLMLARRRLLSGTGEPVQWHPSLQDEAPILTILAVVRLVHQDDRFSEWEMLPSSNNNNGASSPKQIMTKPKAVDNEHWEFVRGESFGRSDTFLLRGKGIILNTSVSALFDVIKNERHRWDELCHKSTLIEKQENNAVEDDGDDVNSEKINWDVVEHIAVPPQKARALGYLYSWKSLSLPKKYVPLCLFRAWKMGEKDGRNAILAAQSVGHPNAAKDFVTEVLPSGWLLNPVYDGSSVSGVSVTYVVEHNLRSLRKAAGGQLSDEQIIATMASSAQKWFTELAMITQQTNVNK